MVMSATATRKRCVAGTTVPAFVERLRCPYRHPGRPGVAGQRSRPSLSGDERGAILAELRSVAGTTVPAFVERVPSYSIRLPRSRGQGVAGTTVPAFVERLLRVARFDKPGAARRVSPGLRSRAFVER